MGDANAGGCVLDAVEAAVADLKDDPVFCAGHVSAEITPSDRIADHL